MKPHIHYNPNKITTFAADKASILFIFSVIAPQESEIGHFDVKSGFELKTYGDDKLLYTKNMPKFKGLLLHPNMPIGRLKLDLYKTNTGAQIYYAEWVQHLLKHVYRSISAALVSVIKKPNWAIYWLEFRSMTLLCQHQRKQILMRFDLF